jgi:hypothetical protein
MEKYRITDADLVSFNSDLFSELHSGMRKNMSNIYILVIRKYGGKNSLIYSYISYPISFEIALLYYFSTRVSIANDRVHKEWGNFMSLLDKTLDPKGNYIYNSNFDNLANESFIRDCYRQRLPYYQHLFNKVLRLTYLLSTDEIVEVIDYAYRHDYDKMLDYLHTDCKYWEEVKKHIDLKQKQENLLHRIIFFTTDLTGFIDMIKSKGYAINGGPQSQRAEVNEMQTILSTLDAEFREALYNNYKYNIDRTGLGCPHRLSRTNFSFRHIHMKLGELKY